MDVHDGKQTSKKGVSVLIDIIEMMKVVKMKRHERNMTIYNSKKKIKNARPVYLLQQHIFTFCSIIFFFLLPFFLITIIMVRLYLRN